MDSNLLPTTVSEQVRTMATVLALVREDRAKTRPEIGRQSGLARNVVADRVDQLIHAGLLAEGELGASTGGRAPRELRFKAEAGYVLLSGGYSGVMEAASQGAAEAGGRVVGVEVGLFRDRGLRVNRWVKDVVTFETLREQQGFRKLVLEENGVPVIVDNPRWQSPAQRANA